MTYFFPVILFIGKPRKQIRKEQRKNAKQIKHQNKLNWLRRRKGVTIASDDTGNEATNKSYHTNDNFSIKKPKLSDNDDLEIEYLERQLLKGKKQKGVSLFDTLRNEFLNDGFDNDFLDFLSNIEHLKAEEKVLTDFVVSQNKAEPPVNVHESASVSSESEEEKTEMSKRRVRFDMPEKTNRGNVFLK